MKYGVSCTSQPAAEMGSSKAMQGPKLGRRIVAVLSADSCAAAASHLERRAGQLPHMASLIVCPPTLVAHWPHEIRKFVGSGQVSIVQARDCGSTAPAHGMCTWLGCVLFLTLQEDSPLCGMPASELPSVREPLL